MFPADDDSKLLDYAEWGKGKHNRQDPRTPKTNQRHLCRTRG